MTDRLERPDRPDRPLIEVIDVIYWGGLINIMDLIGREVEGREDLIDLIDSKKGREGKGREGRAVLRHIDTQIEGSTAAYQPHPM